MPAAGAAKSAGPVSLHRSFARRILRVLRSAQLGEREARADKRCITPVIHLSGFSTIQCPARPAAFPDRASPEARRENRDLIDKNRDLIERNHDVVISILGDTRERLARIEGHLRIGWPATDDPESDSNNREAA